MATRKKRRPRSGGLGRVSEAAAKTGKGKAEWVKLDDGDLLILRVLDTGSDFKDGYFHRVPMERDMGKGQVERRYVDVYCLDQDDKGKPCPGCKDDIQRRYKFFTNVIVRGDEDEETEDTIKIWSGGITVAKMLDKMQAKRDLTLRDIEVEREGSGKNDTKYDVDWADDEDSELSDEDKELAKKKYDLARYVKAPEFDDFYTPPWERDRDDDDEDEDRPTRSAFKRRAKKDDDEEEPKRTASRRRSKPSSKTEKPKGLSGFGGKDKGSSSSSAKKTTVRKRRSR